MENSQSLIALFKEKYDIDIPQTQTAFNISGIGESMPFPNAKMQGTHGYAEKHLTSSNQVIVIKTIPVVSQQEKEKLKHTHPSQAYTTSRQFKSECKTLQEAGLLLGTEYQQETRIARIAMKYVPGETYEQYLQSHAPLQKPFDLAISIIDTLEKWHSKGYAHNNPCRQNIIIQDIGVNQYNIVMIGFSRACLLADIHLDDRNIDVEILGYTFSTLIDPLPDSAVKNLLQQMTEQMRSAPNHPNVSLQNVKKIFQIAKVYTEVFTQQRPSSFSHAELIHSIRVLKEYNKVDAILIAFNHELKTRFGESLLPSHPVASQAPLIFTTPIRLLMDGLKATFQSCFGARRFNNDPLNSAEEGRSTSQDPTRPR